jgi:hypothetical protein
MALNDKIEAVKKISQALGKDPIAEADAPLERLPPNKERFDSLVDSEQQNRPSSSSSITQPISAPTTAQPVVVEKAQLVSYMEQVKNLHRQVDQLAQLTPGDIKSKAQQTIDQIEKVKTDLKNSTSKIKPSYQALLKNRLTHIDDSLRVALSKAGVEYTPAAAPSNTLNPVERFVGYLTQSQYQLEHLQDTINELNIAGPNLTPANMLAIQIKVGQVQQQVELFTSLLNKALESTKTLMNVQV